VELEEAVVVAEIQCILRVGIGGKKRAVLHCSTATVLTGVL
jgi:hypothetical protein